jgi:hypothetical protein
MAPSTKIFAGSPSQESIAQNYSLNHNFVWIAKFTNVFYIKVFYPNNPKPPNICTPAQLETPYFPSLTYQPS